MRPTDKEGGREGGEEEAEVGHPLCTGATKHQKQTDPEFVSQSLSLCPHQYFPLPLTPLSLPPSPSLPSLPSVFFSSPSFKNSSPPDFVSRVLTADNKPSDDEVIVDISCFSLLQPFPPSSVLPHLLPSPPQLLSVILLPCFLPSRLLEITRLNSL